MTDNKPSRNEEEYFAKLEAEKLAKQRAEAKKERDEEARKAHFMKCPKCGGDLKAEQYHNIEVDRCVECSGIWFDKGEAESLLDQEENAAGGIMRSIFKGLS